MDSLFQTVLVHKVSLGLAIMLLLVTLNSTYYFLVIAKVKAVEWLVFNACAPSNLVFLVGFMIYLFTQNRLVMNMAILPMFFFGGLGLFLFPWKGFNLVAQISHIVMTLNVLWTVFSFFVVKDYQISFTGLLLGILFFSPFIGFQQSYVNTHPNALTKILGVNPGDFHGKYGLTPERK